MFHWSQSIEEGIIAVPNNTDLISGINNLAWHPGSRRMPCWNRRSLCLTPHWWPDCYLKSTNQLWLKSHVIGLSHTEFSCNKISKHLCCLFKWQSRLDLDDRRGQHTVLGYWYLGQFLMYHQSDNKFKIMIGTRKKSNVIWLLKGKKEFFLLKAWTYCNFFQHSEVCWNHKLTCKITHNISVVINGNSSLI